MLERVPLPWHAERRRGVYYDGQQPAVFDIYSSPSFFFLHFLVLSTTVVVQ